MLFLFRNPPGFSLSQAPPTSTQRALSAGVPSITPSGKHTFPPAPNPSPPTTALMSSPSFISLSFALTLSPQSPCSTPSAPSPSRSLCLTKVTSDRTEPLSQLTGVPPMSPHQGGPGKPGALLWLWLLDVQSWPMLPFDLLRSPPSLTAPTVFHMHLRPRPCALSTSTIIPPPPPPSSTLSSFPPLITASPTFWQVTLTLTPLRGPPPTLKPLHGMTLWSCGLIRRALYPWFPRAPLLGNTPTTVGLSLIFSS